MKAIKYILAVAILAVCVHFLFPTRKAYFHDWEIVSIDDTHIEDAYIHDDFEEYCFQEYLRRSTPTNEWYGGVCYEKFLKTQMEIFYGL